MSRATSRAARSFGWEGGRDERTNDITGETVLESTEHLLESWEKKKSLPFFFVLYLTNERETVALSPTRKAQQNSKLLPEAYRGYYWNRMEFIANFADKNVLTMAYRFVGFKSAVYSESHFIPPFLPPLSSIVSICLLQSIRFLEQFPNSVCKSNFLCLYSSIPFDMSEFYSINRRAKRKKAVWENRGRENDDVSDDDDDDVQHPWKKV